MFLMLLFLSFRIVFQWIHLFSMPCLWHQVHGSWQFWTQRKDLMMVGSVQGGQGAPVLHRVNPRLKRRCHVAMMVGGMEAPRVPGSSKPEMFPIPLYHCTRLPRASCLACPHLVLFGTWVYSFSQALAYLRLVQYNWTIYLLTWCLWPCSKPLPMPCPTSYTYIDTLWYNLIPNSEGPALNPKIGKAGDGVKEQHLGRFHP